MADGMAVVFFIFGMVLLFLGIFLQLMTTGVSEDESDLAAEESKAYLFPMPVMAMCVFLLRMFGYHHDRKP